MACTATTSPMIMGRLLLRIGGRTSTWATVMAVPWLSGSLSAVAIKLRVCSPGASAIKVRRIP